MNTDPRWNRLGELFDQALELPEEARAGWLDEACGDDVALRAEINAMLKAHQLRQGILESDLVTDTRAVLQETVAEALADRYEVERLLGEGGMASVFVAHERKHGRRVVIKVLKPQIAARYGVDRFLREVRIAARLAHPSHPASSTRRGTGTPLAPSCRREGGRCGNGWTGPVPPTS